MERALERVNRLSAHVTAVTTPAGDGGGGREQIGGAARGAAGGLQPAPTAGTVTGGTGGRDGSPYASATGRPSSYAQARARADVWWGSAHVRAAGPAPSS